jgi:hypothetical protein
VRLLQAAKANIIYRYCCPDRIACPVCARQSCAWGRRGSSESRTSESLLVTLTVVSEMHVPTTRKKWRVLCLEKWEEDFDCNVKASLR